MQNKLGMIRCQKAAPGVQFVVDSEGPFPGDRIDLPSSFIVLTGMKVG
jgi:hypothetical protein